jgi:hypothetical protein
MLKLQIIHTQQVYVHVAVATKPHTDDPRLLHFRSRLYFLGCVTQEAHRCVVLLLQQYVHVIVDV